MPPVPPPDAPPPDTTTPPATGAPRRGEALGCGIGCGAMILVATAAIAVPVFDLDETRGGSAFAAFGLLGGAAILGGWGMRFQTGRTDRTNQTRQAAPALPARLVAEGDRVWVEGTVVCPSPVLAPHFGTPFAWLHARIVRGTGKSKRTERDDRQAAPTWVADGGVLVELDLRRVAFHQVPQWSGQDGNRTVTVTGVPAGTPVSVCGVVRSEPRQPPPAVVVDASDRAGARGLPDKKPTAVDEDHDGGADGVYESGAGRDGDPPALVLGGFPDVPLLVTPLPRLAWCSHVETEEMQWRTAGTTLLCGGAASCAVGAGAMAGLWNPDDPGAWATGLVVGAGAVALALIGGAGARIAASRKLAEDAAAALESDLAHADTDRETAAARVEARLRVYDFFASEHNRMIATGFGAWVARGRNLHPLPIRGTG